MDRRDRHPKGVQTLVASPGALTGKPFDLSSKEPHRENIYKIWQKEIDEGR